MDNKNVKEILDKAKEISNYGADGKQHTRMFNQFEAKALLDYITNLQEENEKSKEYSEFYKDMSDKWKELSGVFKKSCEDYKTRNEKAVEYINNLRDESAERQGFYNCFPDDLYIADIEELLEILQGKSDE